MAILIPALFGGYSSAAPAAESPRFEQVDGYYPIGLGYYRGGPSLEPRPNEVKIRDGLVQTTHGVSVHRNAAKVERFGGAYAIMSIPESLKVIQRGNDQAHFEIVPAQPMPMDAYATALQQVDLRLAQRVE
ncbi:hypothetical protein [Nocardia sp. NBC_00416]|uniref:hypothetical protein n=1 Tax=Nocardia sp. NBC_00416 TaxID=2975991 RepID=UPI002E1CCAF8